MVFCIWNTAVSTIKTPSQPMKHSEGQLKYIHKTEITFNSSSSFTWLSSCMRESLYLNLLSKETNCILFYFSLHHTASYIPLLCTFIACIEFSGVLKILFFLAQRDFFSKFLVHSLHHHLPSYPISYTDYFSTFLSLFASYTLARILVV